MRRGVRAEAIQRGGVLGAVFLRASVSNHCASDWFSAVSFGGDDEPVGGGDVLRVVTLDEPAAADRLQPRVRVGDVAFAGRGLPRRRAWTSAFFLGLCLGQ